MARRLFGRVCSALGFLAASACVAQADQQAWTALPEMPPEVVGAEAWVRPTKFAAWRLSDLERLKAVLAVAPMEVLAEDGPQPVPVEIAIPRPDGGFAFFAIVEAPVMAPALAVQFPEIRTYRGQGLDDPSANIRLDLTPQGFHASVLGPNGSYYIDPFSKADTVYYASYYIQDLGRVPGNYRCYTEEAANLSGQNPDGFGGEYGERTSGTTLRTFQLAMAGTGEFTAFHGGTVALGQAAIVTGVNRVTQVFENECAIRFTLVPNNSNLVYTNAATDPYTNASVLTMLEENQSNCDAVIGSGGYDIGHVVGRANQGGVAQLAVVCSSGNKARGATAINSPTGDFFWVGYVCHEMGHQFSATHSFNSNTSPCIENRSSGTAFEPGSGSTIMSYAGICGADNVVSQSSPYFHTRNYDQILGHATSRTCDTESATGNLIPTADAGLNKTVPQGTAFEMTGVSTDGNGDSLTYLWEQIDLGVAQTLAAMVAADNGTSPIFRSFPAVASPIRTFPRLTDVLDGSLSAGERYPGAARTMDLRFTVRDNRSGGGGVNADTAILTVSTAAGPFRVTSPNTNVSWSGAQTVTWDVASTNVAPVSTALVDILLSTDGGATFPTVLAAATPNDGSQGITLPGVTVTSARIKIKAVGNYYFDISNTNFTITCPTIAVPTGLTASDGTLCDRVSLAWSAVGGAVDYEVFRGTGPVGAVASSIGIVAGTSFDDLTAAAGTTFYYFVKARSACASSNFSVADTGFRGGVSNAPGGFSASDSTSCNEVSLSWTAVGGATVYRVVRNTVNDAASGTLVGTTGATTLSDSLGTPGVTYFYFVRGENPSCGDGAYSAGEPGTRAATAVPPTAVAASDGTSCDSVTVSWNASVGATSYLVWRSVTDDSGAATQIATDSASPYVDVTAVAGTGYFYWVRAVNGCGTGAFGLSDLGNRGSSPAAPSGVSASDGISCSQVDVSWTAAAGATSYEVYRNETNATAGADVLTTTAGTFFADTTAAAGTTYFYFVKALGTCGASAFSTGDSGLRSGGAEAPTAASSNRDNFCPDDSGTITLSASGGSGETLRWFTGSCGGSEIGVGDGLVIASPEATSTYFARWESGCGQSACASVTVTVSTAPEAPVSVSADRSGFCADDAGTISLSAAGGGGDTLRWYSGVCGGASIGSGNPLTIDSPSGATTYFAAWENACGLSACVSTVVEVEPAPAIASVVLSGSSPYTQGSSVSVIVTLASPAGNQGATIAVTSSAFAQATISVAPNALSGSESVILANVGSSQFASAIAMSCSIGAASSASFDVVGLAAILYVSAAGDDSNDGLAPATSLRNIQTAIHRLVPGGLVIIADGIYSESLVVDRSLTLSGAINARPTTAKNTSRTASCVRVSDLGSHFPCRRPHGHTKVMMRDMPMPMLRMEMVSFTTVIVVLRGERCRRGGVHGASRGKPAAAWHAPPGDVDGDEHVAHDLHAVLADEVDETNGLLAVAPGGRQRRHEIAADVGEQLPLAPHAAARVPHGVEGEADADDGGHPQQHHHGRHEGAGARRRVHAVDVLRGLRQALVAGERL